MPNGNHSETIRALADRIVEAQRPIRILDAVKWDETIEQAFFAKNASELPPVTPDYYTARPLPFKPEDKSNEFMQIERDTVRQLGQFSPAGQIMARMCREYVQVVRMLSARGTSTFSDVAAQLYGSAKDAFHAGDPTLADLGVMMAEALERIDAAAYGDNETKSITGERAVEILQQSLRNAFPGADGEQLRVFLSDGIVADAAAGADYIKLRKEAMFSPRDLRLLEIHEGWVHLGTTLNGMAQPVCTFLSKGPPSSTVTQEGLAVLMEVLTFSSHPERLRRVTNRIRAVDMAESGAEFLEVYRFYQEEGYSDRESYGNTTRVFRGSLPDGGPFTKDLSYSKGFVLVYNFIRLAVVKGMLNRIPLLFCGKTRLEDMRSIKQLADEGLIVPPKFLPPNFADMQALIAWMCYSSFLSRLSLERIEQDYIHIL